MNNQQDHHPENFTSQFESMSSFSRWAGWLSIMLIICLILVIAYLIDQANPESSGQAISIGMYLIIFSLAIGLIYKSYQDARFLDTEMKLSSEQVRLLEKVDDFESFLESAPKSIFRSHIDNLHIISLSHHEINQDNLIEILHTRLMAKNKIVELFASILITLGLIGTIIGLVIMMDGLTAAMAAQGQGQDNADLLSKLADPINGPLAGLGTAFYTTLLGAVFGGVILRVLTNVIDENIIRYTAHLAELTEVYVLPHMRSTAKKMHDN